MAYIGEKIKRKDGSEIFIHKWVNDNIDMADIKGIFQIVHGAAEHAKRYEQFAEKLNELGYVVVGDDHSGHGVAAKGDGNLGFFGEENGWNRLVEDEVLITKHIIEQYPDKPIILFGHSMGSFISRDYIRVHSHKLDGLVISGTGNQSKGLIKLAKLIARSEMKIRGDRHRSVMLDNLSFGKFNDNFKPNRSEFDWLSRDPDKVDEYITDEKCGFICTTSMFNDLSKGLLSISNLKTLENCNKSLPILFISGTKDPVGDFGKGVRNVFDNYKAAGFDDVSMDLYPNARHELLNETNRLDIYLDILKWLNTKSNQFYTHL